MNFKYLTLAFISAFMLSGCALIKNNNSQDINKIEHKIEKANYEAYGAERMDVLGMVATNMEDRCSLVEFFKFATKVYPNADDMINIHMDEIETKQGTQTTYTCKYTGLAVSYTPMALEEAKKWKEPAAAIEPPEPGEPKVIVIHDKPEPVAPACQPCYCVTCGCQPCNAINANNQ